MKTSPPSRNCWFAGSLFLLSLTAPLCAQPLFTAAPGSPLTGATPYAVAVGDFNGDGKLDMATANADTNNVTVLLGNGTGGFGTAPGSPFAGGAFLRSVAAGDFNRDGSWTWQSEWTENRPNRSRQASGGLRAARRDR